VVCAFDGGRHQRPSADDLDHRQRRRGDAARHRQRGRRARHPRRAVGPVRGVVRLGGAEAADQRHVAIAGTVYGALLFVVNFIYLAPLAFYAFDKANSAFELFARLVYGLLVSFAFFGSGIRQGEPVIAIQGREPRWARDGTPLTSAAPRKLRKLRR